jgi:hypothetical protein
MGFEAGEIQKFSQVGRAVSAALRITVEQWALGESAIMLRRWAGATKVANAERVVFEARSRAGKRAQQNAAASLAAMKLTVNTGKRKGTPGRVWVRTRNRKWQDAGDIVGDAHFVPSWIHYADAVWKDLLDHASDYAKTIEKMKPRALRSIALARQSIVQIADQLGVTMESAKGGGIDAAGIAKARQAIASDGRYYQNGRGIRDQDQNSFFVELINGYPRIKKMQMDVVFEGIIRDRTAESRRALETNAFASAQKTARTFPYVSLN